MHALACLAPAVLALATHDPGAERDADRDGLSDFQEQHKYCTNPDSADSDADGTPDGDWRERREYAYTVRSLVQVLRPVTPDVLCDDYQDARILDETEEYVELEVVHYPLNTVAQALRPDPDWRAHTEGMQAWLQPGPTANWDAQLRARITADLLAAGIDASALDDRTLVERASAWLLEHARCVDGFTTFLSTFEAGQARVCPGLEQAVADGQADKGLTVEQQWQRELFAKSMYEQGVRGSCTSSAIYLDGCLRALGIPTRIVLTIPLIDASDEREIGLLQRLRHHGVRRAVQLALGTLSRSWTSHTFNEVWVGGRWRRLNYEHLGQNTLDAQFLGLMTHVATFSDWADGDMAATWGVRQATRGFSDDAFGGANPYSTLALSDRFGRHARIDNPIISGEYEQLTIDQAGWFRERPAGVDMRIDDLETAGHLIVHVVEGRAGEGTRQYSRFYDRVGKGFALRAAGRPDVPAQAMRGYWAAPEKGLQHFYLRIEPKDYALMAAGVPHALCAIDASSECRWIVRPGVTLVREESTLLAAPQLPPPAPAASPAAEPAPAELVLSELVWSDAPGSPTGILQGMGTVLLALVGAAADFPSSKRFTELADRRFFLEADGHPTLEVGAAVGGLTTREHSYVLIELGPADWRDLVSGVEYALRPQNSDPRHVWKLPKALRVKR